jgi:hypothetical protein
MDGWKDGWSGLRQKKAQPPRKRKQEKEIKN